MKKVILHCEGNVAHLRCPPEDDIESFQASQLPEHLVSIGEILLEEEASLGDTGPCVEFFLQNKIVETLCALAERDVCN